MSYYIRRLQRRLIHTCPIIYIYKVVDFSISYIISSHNSGRITTDKLQPHAEPTKSVSLFCCKSTAYDDN